MVADTGRIAPAQRWLDSDKVDPHGQCRQGRAVGQCAGRRQSVDRASEMRPLAAVERLLREAETPIVPPAHLDEDQGGRRIRVDRHDIELAVANADVPADDPPARGHQATCDELFRHIADLARHRWRRPGC
jgi:hypothetical protein